MVDRWQYQAKAEPVLVPAPVEDVSFGWFVQGTDLIRRPPQVRAGLYASVQEVEVIEIDLDWFQQYPEQVFRRKHQTQEGMLAQGVGDREITPRYDWYHQQPEQVFRRPHQTDEGFFSYVADVEVLEVDLDWFVQHPEIMFRRRHQVNEGASVHQAEIELLEIDLDWNVPQPDVIRPRPQVMEGYYVSAPFPVPTFSATDWPFLALLDPSDHPAGTRFYLAAVIDTSDPTFPVSARLFNITDSAEVPGSNITTGGAHLTTDAWVKSGVLELVSGAKEYRVERGGEASSGATVHLHWARLLVEY